MTEATMASQVVTIDPPPLPSQAGHLRPVEKIGFGIGQMRVPETNHAVGLRGGPRVDLWHGSLGDTQSAWMGSVGLELGTVFALSRLNPPWQSDSTVTTDWVLMPSVMAGGALRFGHPEQSRFAAVYSLSLSVGLQFSSSFVP
jgi:hypothetical protein